MALNPKDLQQVADNLREATEQVAAIANTLLAASQTPDIPPGANLAREVIGHLVSADHYLEVACRKFQALLISPPLTDNAYTTISTPIGTRIVE